MTAAPAHLLPAGSNGRRRPVGKVDSWEWQDAAACSDIHWDVFFVEERGAVGRKRVAVARSVCHGCPVRLECLAQAIRCGEPYGVWGGCTERERRWLRHLIAQMFGPSP